MGRATGRAACKQGGDKELSKMTHVDLHSLVNNITEMKWQHTFTRRTSRADQPEGARTLFQ